MNLTIELQNACNAENIPSENDFKKWTHLVLDNRMSKGEICIRIVDETESAELNFAFRKKNKPTNILSFPADLPESIKTELSLLGDLVVSHDIVKKEALMQGKPLQAHWAHLIIHGTLHLLGYDHINNADAIKMETLEINYLKQLGLPNPYGDRTIT